MLNEKKNHENMDQLREELLAGGFGREPELFEAAEADEETVDGFLEMFASDQDTPLKAYDWVVHLPGSIGPDYRGNLYGVVREESESIYILPFDQYRSGAYYLGYLGQQEPLPDDKEPLSPYRLETTVEDGEVHMEIVDTRHHAQQGKPVRVRKYDMFTKLFSRNSGLLESSIMMDNCAVLVGCGSVGSLVAMELARSGVGHFVLCDMDVLEIHNICRHQCGFDDLGRYKVDAVRDKILNINPNAEVVTFRSAIQDIPKEELLPYLGRKTVIIGGGDNRASADDACKLAVETDCGFVATACWTRAFAGEVFYWESGRDLACYHCAMGGQISRERPTSHHTYFGSEEEKSELAFEPGIAADVDFVTIIAVKVALDLLNRDHPGYTQRVLPYLRQLTWICNTNSTKIGGPGAAIFSRPLQITYNLRVHHDEDCPICAGR